MPRENGIYYLSIPDLLVIHYVVMDGYFIDYERDVSQEQAGVKEPSLFLSALNEPKQTFDGKDLYPTLHSKAAALMRSLIKNHAFHNGNKRTAVLSTVLFLEMNMFNVTAEESRLFRLAMWIVHTKPPLSIDRIAKSLRKYTRESFTKTNQRDVVKKMAKISSTGRAIDKVLEFLRTRRF